MRPAPAQGVTKLGHSISHLKLKEKKTFVVISHTKCWELVKRCTMSPNSGAVDWPGTLTNLTEIVSIRYSVACD